MTQTFTITPATYLLLVLCVIGVIGVGIMIRLLRVNTRILREHRINRAANLMHGGPDAEGLEEPPYDPR